MELAQARKARISARHGGRVLADALVAQGIDHVFEVPGESFLDTLDGLYDQSGKIKLVTCRFEAGAVNMADAFGKLTGRPAAAMVTRGPGACHGAIGVHVAFQDSTPMLLFVGQIPHEDTGRDAFQEVDYRQMFAPLAKWVTQIDHAKRIPEVVAHAVDVATSGRPGPVVIALSEEMQKDQVVGPRSAARQSYSRVPRPRSAGANASLAGEGEEADRHRRRLMLDRLRAARRCTSFFWRNNVPVTVGFRRQAHYDGNQINFAGDLGVGSDPGLIAKFKEADLILAIGSRLGDAVTQGFTLLDMAGSVPIVQVLPDGAEIGRVFRTALGIVSDLNMFAIAAAGLEPVKPSWAKWTQELRSLREAQRAVPNYRGPLNLGTVMRELETMLTPRCDRDHRCRQLRRLGNAVPEFLRRAALYRTDQRGDGLQRAGRGRRQDRLPRSHGRQHGRRRRLHDDRTRNRHRLPPWRCANRAGVQQPDVRHDPHASGKSLSLARFRHRPDQPGFRQIYRGVRRPWRGRQRHRGVRPRVPPSG